THIGLQVRLATVLRNFCQIWCVIGTFAKKRVAVYAVVFVPDILAVSDLGGNILCMSQFGKLSMAIQRQYQKNQCRDGGGSNCKKTGLSIIHGRLSALDTNTGPIEDGN